MRTQSLKQFFLEEAVNYASYSTIRMIGSAIDGQKNTSRKILFFCLKKKIKDEIKVLHFDSQAQAFTEFLHGSMYNPIVTLARNYVGTNNINLLYPSGNFGTRFINNPAAPRYIYTYGKDVLFNTFDIRDVLIEQEFEGTKIEPLFFVPSLPYLAINGSSGVSSGFKQEILPRNPIECLTYLFSPKEKQEQLQLKPYFKGFKGKVIQGENPCQWIIEGIIKRDSKNKSKLTITEIPIGYDFQGYKSVLKKLTQDKKIKFKDFSDSTKDEFLFEIQLLDNQDKSDSEILDFLKLRKKVTEIFNAIDRNNKIITFNNIKEILDYYKEIRLEYQEKQKNYDLSILNENLNYLKSKIIFIKLIIENKLIISKRPKQDIVNDLEQLKLPKQDNSYDYLLKLPIYSLTFEKIKELADEVRAKSEQRDLLTNTSTIKLWSDSIKLVQQELSI